MQEHKKKTNLTMYSSIIILVFLLLISSSVNAVTFIDHFNDTSLNSALWGTLNVASATESGTILTVTSASGGTPSNYGCVYGNSSTTNITIMGNEYTFNFTNTATGNYINIGFESTIECFKEAGYIKGLWISWREQGLNPDAVFHVDDGSGVSEVSLYEGLTYGVYYIATIRLFNNGTSESTLRLQNGSIIANVTINRTLENINYSFVIGDWGGNAGTDNIDYLTTSAESCEPDWTSTDGTCGTTATNITPVITRTYHDNASCGTADYNVSIVCGEMKETEDFNGTSLQAFWTTIGNVSVQNGYSNFSKAGTSVRNYRGIYTNFGYIKGNKYQFRMNTTSAANFYVCGFLDDRPASEFVNIGTDRNQFAIELGADGNFSIMLANTSDFNEWIIPNTPVNTGHFFTINFTINSTDNLAYVDIYDENNTFIKNITSNVTYQNLSYYFACGDWDGNAGEVQLDYIKWVSMEGCTENWEQINGSCINNDTFLITYNDTNGCGTTNDLPENNGTSTGNCDYCTQNIVNVTANCSQGYIYHYYVDNNFSNCCNITGIYSDCSILYPPYDEIINETCCLENWTVNYGDCLIDDSLLVTYIDNGLCNTTNNLPVDNGTYIACNYCFENITESVTECIDGWQTTTYTDENFIWCCYITNLESDCSILYPPYDEGIRANCTEPDTGLYCQENLTNDFPCQYDDYPILHEKMNVVCEINDTKDYRCVVNILQNNTLLSTNPEYREASDSLFNLKGQGDTREFFTPENRLLNSFYTQKNLRTDTPFTLEVICTSNDTTIKSQYCIIPKYIKPDWIANIGAWAARNMVFIIAIALLLALFIGIAIHYIKRL